MILINKFENWVLEGTIKLIKFCDINSIYLIINRISIKISKKL